MTEKSTIDCLADAVEKLGHNANWLATRMDAVETRKDASNAVSGTEWAKSVAKGRSKDEILGIASDKENAAKESARRAESMPQGAGAWKSDAKWHAEGAKALREIASGMKAARMDAVEVRKDAISRYKVTANVGDKFQEGKEVSVNVNAESDSEAKEKAKEHFEKSYSSVKIKAVTRGS